MWSWLPKVFRIVPIRSDAKRPCAMAPSASIPYRFAEITIFFLLRNSLKFILLLFLFLSSLSVVKRGVDRCLDTS